MGRGKKRVQLLDHVFFFFSALTALNLLDILKHPSVTLDPGVYLHMQLNLPTHSHTRG